MPVTATQVNGETEQAIGAQAGMLVVAEASWGTTPAAATRRVRCLPGETLDQNVATYASRQLRNDRTANRQVRGSHDPGGSIPFELSPDGWNWALYSLLLPSAVVTTGPTGSAINPSAAPVFGSTGSGSGSSLAPATYYYVYTGINTVGETKPSPVSAGMVNNQTLINGTIAISIGTCTSYNIYRGATATGPFYYCATTATINWQDDGTYTGVQAPEENSQNLYYTHVVKGGTSAVPLPIGYSLEKQFGGIATPIYETFAGLKVDRMTLNFAVDAIPSGSFDFIGKSFTAGTTSAFSGGSPGYRNFAPYTSAYVALYEAGSTNQLGLCTDLQLTISNNYRRKNGFVLGSVNRQNLKPGTRTVEFSGKFMFQDLNLYNKAITPTLSSIKIVCTQPNLAMSHEFLMGTVEFSPNQSAPRMTDDGPLEISLHGMALMDTVTGTNIQVTILTPEPNITT